jgi:GMP synthase (glutamine-hydrolysing)
MILIIDMCYEKDSLSNLEFVQPIRRIVESAGKKTKVVHFSELDAETIGHSERIIMCGTALKDNEFVYHKDAFEFLKDYKKPVLGICAGMQMIALVFGGKLIQEKEIGMTQVITMDPIFGDTMISAYELHGNGIVAPEGFHVIAENVKGIQAIQKDRIYGIVFHPEVRNKQLILNFLKL